MRPHSSLPSKPVLSLPLPQATSPTAIVLVPPMACTRSRSRQLELSPRLLSLSVDHLKLLNCAPRQCEPYTLGEWSPSAHRQQGPAPIAHKAPRKVSDNALQPEAGQCERILPRLAMLLSLSGLSLRASTVPAPNNSHRVMTAKKEFCWKWTCSVHVNSA